MQNTPLLLLVDSHDIIIYYMIEGIYMYLTKINCDLLICSPLSLPYSSHKLKPCTLATVHRKKSTRNFVVHVTNFFLLKVLLK